jgi:hypothetical protein
MRPEPNTSATLTPYLQNPDPNYVSFALKVMGAEVDPHILKKDLLQLLQSMAKLLSELMSMMKLKIDTNQFVKQTFIPYDSYLQCVRSDLRAPMNGFYRVQERLDEIKYASSLSNPLCFNVQT